MMDAEDNNIAMFDLISPAQTFNKGVEKSSGSDFVRIRIRVTMVLPP